MVEVTKIRLTFQVYQKLNVINATYYFCFWQDNGYSSIAKTQLLVFFTTGFFI